MRREWRRGEPWDRVDAWGIRVLVGGCREWFAHRRLARRGKGAAPSIQRSLSSSSIPRNLTPVKVAAEVRRRIFIVGVSRRRPGPEKELAGSGWVCKQLWSDGKCLEGRGASELSRFPK